MAKEGSLHGYDIIDHTILNPEIGTEKEYYEFVNELKKYEMGQILDIVPNHMCITSRYNQWWMDVLENGQSSLYAQFFDIEWNPVKKELRDKILLPVLGDQYGRVLENQELSLTFEDGKFSIYYYDYVFPLRPKTYVSILNYSLDDLKKNLPDNHPHILELFSIITALKHLPLHTERNIKKIQERDREKEIIKKRLWQLYQDSPEIKAFIDRNVSLYNGVKGDPESFDLLDKLLNEQIYRLSFWRVATEEINYRRFFDINDLAAIRMEEPVVFKYTHKLILQFVREGIVTGLRVDHPDGLYNPQEYFQWLQRSCFVQRRLGHLEKSRRNIPKDLLERFREDNLFTDERKEIEKLYEEIISSDPAYKAFYIVGEKILIKDERMPEEWPIFSTTGYVFMNTLNGIFIKTNNAKIFDDMYSGFIKSKINFQDIIYEKKKLIIQVAMSSEVNTLGHYLNRLSEKNRHTRDFTLNSLTEAIREVIAFFPVYRTYITQSGANDRDHRYIDLAVTKAKRKNPAISGAIFDFLRDVLLLNYNEGFQETEEKEWVDFTMKFQQITGPIMAKGLEDTVFYVYNRFISLNEVGGSPERFGTSLETFHGKNIERIKFWPHALITTSTHDTKRSEDVRARINVLSEIPDEWRKHLIQWRRFNKKRKPVVDGQRVPDLNEEYHLYQTLIGAWPIEEMDATAFDTFKKRIKDYMVKASREAKVNTSWINPNTIYEDAFLVFIESIMNESSNNQFLGDFKNFQERILQYGIYNALSQTLLKITSPGVPDLYQGTELWDFSLVDPDNRRPVDYNQRIQILEELIKRESEIGLRNLCRELTAQRRDGRIKLYLIYKALNFRRAMKKLFENGEYLPLEVMEARTDNVCSFARRLRNAIVIVVAPRFFASLIPDSDKFPMGKNIWIDSILVLPFDNAGVSYQNIFTGDIISTVHSKNTTALYVSEILKDFPVALLKRIT
jgi:(1->4)-alpha-D-glucan 1-alpha-D-glucosylmutase